MGWYGKIMGGALGLFTGGPLGAVAGAALGHLLFDRTTGIQTDYQKHTRTRLNRVEQIQAAYFISTRRIDFPFCEADRRIT